MHVLTTRGGELVSLVGPLCENPTCPGCGGLAGLDSAQLVGFATVANRPDISTTELVSAAAGFVERTGWVDRDPELVAEVAFDMADETAEVAGWYPPGTRVRAAFDRDTDEWTITAG